MKKVILSIGLLFSLHRIQGQNDEYDRLVKKADSLYNVKNYKQSAFTYSEAFKANGWKGARTDRYNAACSWALAGVPDSAFFNLFKIAIRMEYMNFKHISNDPDLITLHEDKRWKVVIDKVKENKDKSEIGLDKPLVAKLDSIFDEDQKYRKQMDGIAEKYGWDSKQMQDLWKVANRADSINLIKVKNILDTHGWLGPDVVGWEGSSTLFLVIQHSDQQTQEKYLPIMREAVKKGKAQPADLALLEDRVALGQGKKQIYGSQIGQDLDHKMYVLPLQDPENVDKRRAEVRLQPLSEYVQIWNIKWDVEDYKKSLPKDQGFQFSLKEKGKSKVLANQTLEVRVIDISKSSDTLRYTVKTNSEGIMEKVVVTPGKKNIWIKPKDCEQIGLMEIMIGESTYLNFSIATECGTKKEQPKKKK